MSIYNLNNPYKKKVELYPHHYSTSTSDDEFIERNITLSKIGGVNSSYPGGVSQLAEDEKNTMGTHERREYDRQEIVARREVPQKYWQDLNRGRHYVRGVSDDLDHTFAESVNYILQPTHNTSVVGHNSGKWNTIYQR